MFSRSLAILVASFLPALAMILPVSNPVLVNAMTAGIAGTILAALSLGNDRARYAAAILGAWTATLPFLFMSTLLEKELCVSWGVLMFAHLIGPFSEPHVVTVTRAVPTPGPSELPEQPYELPRAA
jgi:hypothetical protein